LVPVQREGISGWTCGEGPEIVCLAGPPASALLFRHVAESLASRGFSVWLPEWVHPPRQGAWPAVADRLASAISNEAVLVAHGLAVPLGVAITHRKRVGGLVLGNGPVGALDPVTGGLLGVLRVLGPGAASRLLHPSLLTPLLSSSAALRRTVVNPYVMDRDMVVLLTSPWEATRAHRQVASEYLLSLQTLPEAPPTGVPVAWVWGTADWLYPVPDVPLEWSQRSHFSLIPLPAARFLTVEEQPWLYADRVYDWILDRKSSGHRDTDVVVSGPRGTEARG
jgi:hypothetical protein